MGKLIPDRLHFDRVLSALDAYRLNWRLGGYVVLVSAAGMLMLALNARSSSPASWTSFVWFAFCLLSEFLWLETPTGEATDSMASTFNIAVLCLFGAGISLWIIGLSVFFATRFVQKRDWIKSFFGLGQMVLTAFIAGSVFVMIAGRVSSLAQFQTVRGILALFAVCLVYYGVNTLLVAGAVSLAGGIPLSRIWRVNYGYGTAMLSNVALFSLSPILLISFLTLSYWGVALFFMPLLIVKNQNRQYIMLQRTSQALISSERMAAKGEMAAAVAHEMNNYIAIIMGRGQLLKRKLSKLGNPEMIRDNEVLLTQVDRLTRLAHGLLDFSHKELQITSFDLNELCRETIEFLQPQNDFDKVRIHAELDETLAEVQGDAGQINQILVNLCRNAADAMRDAGMEEGHIWLRTGEDARDTVRLVVEDSGPGVPAPIRLKIFEFGYTTKPQGHGFGLATTDRIAQSHKGRIWVEDRPGGGARFVLTWPSGRKRGLTAQAA